MHMRFITPAMSGKNLTKPHGLLNMKAQVEVQNFRHFNTFHNLMLVSEGEVETVYVTFLFNLP